MSAPDIALEDDDDDVCTSVRGFRSGMCVLVSVVLGLGCVYECVILGLGCVYAFVYYVLYYCLRG